MVLVLGIIFGMVSGKLGGWFETTIEWAVSIDPHAMMAIFLPALVFESAFNSDGFIMNRSKWQILMMAGPGVLVTAGLISVILRFVLNYKDEQNWEQSQVIGSIIATTDPVAVVALLKELGTSVKFNTLLEGESQLNDGTAMVFFQVCLDIVKTGHFQVGPAIVQFIQLSFGGPGIGQAFGLVTVLWMRIILKDAVLAVVITFFSVYLCFFVAESVLHVSGIQALVVLGIFLGTHGKVRITEEIQHSLHVVWGFMGWTLETILFILTGCYIGDKLFKIGGHQENQLVGNDLWKGLLFYFMLFGIRFGVMCTMWPLQNCFGYPINFKSVVIITYGGLRGAIALALAMIVIIDHDIDNQERFQDLCLFYNVVIILLTSFVNGLTVSYLMKGINFIEPNIAHDKTTLRVKQNVLLEAWNMEHDLIKDKVFEFAEWTEVKKLAGFQKDLEDYRAGWAELKKVGGVSKAYSKIVNQTMKEQHEYSEKIISKDSKTNKQPTKKDEYEVNVSKPIEGNTNLNQPPAPVGEFDAKMFVKDEENQNHGKSSKSKQNGLQKESLPETPLNEFMIKRIEDLTPSKNSSIECCDKKRVGDLSFSDDDQEGEGEVEVLLYESDKTGQKIEMRHRIYKQIQSLAWERHELHLCEPMTLKTINDIIHICQDHTDHPICLMEYTNTYLGNHKLLGCCLKLATIKCLGWPFKKYVISRLTFEYGLGSTLVQIVKEISDHNLEEQGKDPGYAEMVKAVDKELNDDIAHQIRIVDNIQNQFKSIIQTVHTKHAAYSIVNMEKKKIKDFKNGGYLEGVEYDNIVDTLDKRLIAIDSWHMHLGELSLLSFIILDFPVFSVLEKNEMAKITVEFEKNKHKYPKDGIICQKGADVENIYFIMSGSVVETFNDHYESHKTTGRHINLTNLILPEFKNVSTVRIEEADTEIVSIEKEILLEIMEKNHAFEELVYQRAFVYMVKMDDGDRTGFNPFEGEPETLLNSISKSSKLNCLQKKQSFKLPHGGYLFNGQVESEDRQTGLASVHKEKTVIIPTKDIFTAKRATKVLEFLEPVFSLVKRGDDFEVDVTKTRLMSESKISNLRKRQTGQGGQQDDNLSRFRGQSIRDFDMSLNGPGGRSQADKILLNADVAGTLQDIGKMLRRASQMDSHSKIRDKKKNLRGSMDAQPLDFKRHFQQQSLKNLTSHANLDGKKDDSIWLDGGKDSIMKTNKIIEGRGSPESLKDLNVSSSYPSRRSLRLYTAVTKKTFNEALVRLVHPDLELKTSIAPFQQGQTPFGKLLASLGRGKSFENTASPNKNEQKQEIHNQNKKEEQIHKQDANEWEYKKMTIQPLHQKNLPKIVENEEFPVD